MRTTRDRGRRQRGLVALAVLVLAALAPVAGSAQEGTGPPEGAGDPTVAPTSPGPWSFAPTTPQAGPGRNWFILELQPGQVIRDSVTIANTTAQPISFAFYPADAYNTENSGEFAIRTATEPKEDVATWVELATDAYTVQPGRRVDIPFEISVPDDAGPGDHVGAIAAMNVNPEGTTESGGVKLDIMRVIGVRLYVRVAGPVSPDLAIEDVRVSTDASAFGVGGSDEGSVTYTVTNTGNATVSPKVRAKVSGGLGGADESLPAHQLRDLLPGNSVEITDTWDGLPLIGPVTVEVSAVADDATARSEQATWIVPWGLLALLAALVVVGVLLVRRRRRRRRAARAPEAASEGPAPVPEPAGA